MEVPKHVAIVMDGNGRWAQRRGRPRVYGHVRGSTRVKGVVTEANRLGVQALTLYAFSTENWTRPEGERTVLWKLLKKYLVREAEELHRQNVQFRVMGELNRLDPELSKMLDRVVQRLSKNTGLQLTLAISYGGRSELTRAARLFAEDCLLGKCSPEMMSESIMENYLWTSGLGNLSAVDLFIRTGGEKRISNFLLWQAAYAECVFLDLCWPDFEPGSLEDAIREYSQRDRRYGGVSKVSGVTR